MKILLLFVVIGIVYAAVDIKAKLQQAMSETNAALSTLRTRWAIDKYPLFLKSVAMSQTSWEVLKLKFESKILAALSNSGSSSSEDAVTFVMSFMGSSVTAGHDSPFNVSFPILVGNIMEKPLSAIGIKVISRNTALGNNPCVPYDLCPRTFSGSDADIVHWEQSYNCGTSDDNRSGVYEQYVRQSLAIPTRPIVVFSESSTPNWNTQDCENKDSSDPKLSDKEKNLVTLLDTDPMKIPFEANKENMHGWSAFTKIVAEYKTAGLQLWDHHFYQAYKCRGPYVKTWGCCSASWHPSLLGHELRAAHYSFFWLLIFQDALKSLTKNQDSLDTLRQHVLKHIDKEQKHIPLLPIYDNSYPDDLQCYTSFEPRADPSLNLHAIVIPGADPSKDFKVDIFENFMEKQIIINAKNRGYLDYKVMLYGNRNNNPLSLIAKIKKTGKGFLCTPPGNWGKYPDGFKKFWEAGTKIYLTENVGPNPKGFTFDASKAKTIEYYHEKPADSQYICVNFKDNLPTGDHVITIVPTTDDNIMISYLLIP